MAAASDHAGLRSQTRRRSRRPRHQSASCPRPPWLVVARKRAGETLLVTAVLASSCALPTSLDPSQAYRSLDGAVFAPLDVPPACIRVMVFVTTECPIANSYAPKLAELSAMWCGTEVELVLVHLDPDLTEASARQHALEHELWMPIVLDPAQRLAVATGASITPEAAVCTRDGVVYLGRIDDRWRARGQDSQKAACNDLVDAVQAVRLGRPVAEPQQPAIGCRLPTVVR